MSELCKYDEQVLDYLYEELAPSDRAAFAEHLAGCESCRRELASLSGVRQHVAELPKPELSPESAAKMKAQLMEAAIAATQQSKHPLGGGKLVQFPSGRVRRILTHPATAALTVAAAALFLVVFQSKEPAVIVSDSPAPAVSAPAAPAVATTQVPVVDSVTESKPSEAPAPVAAPGISGGVARPGEGASALAAAPKAPPTKTGFFDGRTLDAVTRSRSVAPSPSSAASAGPLSPSADAKAVYAKSDVPKKEQAASAPPVAVSPMARPQNQPSVPIQVAQNTRPPMEQPVWSGRAAPPPPPVAESEVAVTAQAPVAQAVPQAAAPSGYVARESIANRDDDSSGSSVVERSKQLQQKRTLDELERAELAQAPNQGGGRRYASTDSSGNVANTGHSATGGKDSQQAEEDQSPTVGKASSASDKAPADRSAISQIYEQIRSGRCNEAQELIQKLERSGTSQPELSEASATWQRDCGARNLIQNVKPMEQLNLAVPMKKAMPAAAPPAPQRMPKALMEKSSLDAPSQGSFEAKRSLRKPAPVQNQNKAPAKANKASSVAY